MELERSNQFTLSKRLEVVIVDDEPHIADMLKMYIEYFSNVSTIHTFNDSCKAKVFIENNAIDMLITDYKMPTYNGIELIELLPPAVKKVLISGYVPDNVRERLEQLGAVYFEKPVPMDVLGELISELERVLIHQPAANRELSQSSFLL